MSTFPYTGIYPFDDNLADDDLFNRCHKIIDCLGNVKLRSEFSVLHLNCRSVLNKLNDIALLNALFDMPPDILMLSETWLTPASYFNLHSYSSYHCIRANGRRGGGVSICVKDVYDTSELQCNFKPTVFEFVGRVIKTSLQSTVCVCVYRPPSSSLDIFLDEFDRFIELLLSVYAQCKLIIASDFNINLLDNSSSTSTFLDVMLCHAFYPTIFTPTRSASKSLLSELEGLAEAGSGSCLNRSFPLRRG